MFQFNWFIVNALACDKNSMEAYLNVEIIKENFAWEKYNFQNYTQRRNIFIGIIVAIAMYLTERCNYFEIEVFSA